MLKLLGAVILAGWCVGAGEAAADTFIPAGQGNIDGIPVTCGPYGVLLSVNAPGVAFFNGQMILINPLIFNTQPTFLKLFIYAHECGHSVVGSNEDWADCWATKVGRNQGWFPPQAFQLLIQQLQRAPGDWTHKPGPARLQNIAACYQTP